MKLDHITPAMVNQAVTIYLRHAYSDESLREAHTVRFEQDDVEAILAEWEREDGKLRSYTLRLGCEHYPHMKLALWEAYEKNNFVFAVDRHDGFEFDNTDQGFENWLGVKSKNFKVKADIENAWYEAGLPTMRRMREEKLTQSDILREFSDYEVLLVDNDGDATAIMEVILSTDGYGCRKAGSIADVQAIMDDDEARSRCGLALVDLLLSDGSGIQVVRKLREMPGTKDIPIVLTSAMNPQDVSLDEVDGYLRKPYSADDLRAVVEDMIRRFVAKREREPSGTERA